MGDDPLKQRTDGVAHVFAIIDARERSLSGYRAATDDEIAAERRVFNVGMTRAERLSMYASSRDRFNNPPGRFLTEAGIAVA